MFSCLREKTDFVELCVQKPRSYDFVEDGGFFGKKLNGETGRLECSSWVDGVRKNFLSDHLKLI